MQPRALIAAISLLLAMAAEAMPRASTRGFVFRDPSAWLGREVRVCGYLIGPANITERRGNPHAGLSVQVDPGERRLVEIARAHGEYAHVCLTGTIVHVGCATDPNLLCTDSAFDYAIRVRAVN